MKSNWSVGERHLTYAGSGFLGIVSIQGPYIAVYFTNGMGAEVYKESPIENFTSLKDAIDRVEKFFEQGYSKQKEWFEAHALERDRNVELKRRKVSISY